MRRNFLKQLGVRPQTCQIDWWCLLLRKTRKDRLPEQTRTKVKEFYLEAEVSRESPHQRQMKNNIEKRIVVVTIYSQPAEEDASNQNKNTAVCKMEKSNLINNREHSNFAKFDARKKNIIDSKPAYYE